MAKRAAKGTNPTAVASRDSVRECDEVRRPAPVLRLRSCVPPKAPFPIFFDFSTTSLRFLLLEKRFERVLVPQGWILVRRHGRELLRRHRVRRADRRRVKGRRVTARCRGVAFASSAFGECGVTFASSDHNKRGPLAGIGSRHDALWRIVRSRCWGRLVGQLRVRLLLLNARPRGLGRDGGSSTRDVSRCRPTSRCRTAVPHIAPDSIRSSVYRGRRDVELLVLFAETDSLPGFSFRASARTRCESRLEVIRTERAVHDSVLGVRVCCSRRLRRCCSSS